MGKEYLYPPDENCLQTTVEQTKTTSTTTAVFGSLTPQPRRNFCDPLTLTPNNNIEKMSSPCTPLNISQKKYSETPDELKFSTLQVNSALFKTPEFEETNSPYTHSPFQKFIAPRTLNPECLVVHKICIRLFRTPVKFAAK